MFSPDLPKSAAQNCSCGCLRKYPILPLSVTYAKVTAPKTKATWRMIEFILLFFCSLDLYNSSNFDSERDNFIHSFGRVCSTYDTYILLESDKLRQRLTSYDLEITNHEQMPCVTHFPLPFVLPWPCKLVVSEAGATSFSRAFPLGVMDAREEHRAFSAPIHFPLSHSPLREEVAEILPHSCLTTIIGCDSAGGKTLLSLCSRTSFLTGDGIKYSRKRVFFFFYSKSHVRL